MLKNYFKTAWRNLWKNRFYSSINIVGLTTGLVVGILILLWVQDELSFDRFHKNTNDIYRVVSHVDAGASIQVWETSQPPVASHAIREVPGVKNAVRIAGNYRYSLFEYKENEFKENNKAFVDPSFFDVFDFRLIEGDPRNPFPDNSSVIITESTAKRYFGDEDPIGKTLTADHETSFVVNGVMEDFPKNSSIQYDILFPMSLRALDYGPDNYWGSMDGDWGNYYCRTYLEIDPKATVQSIGETLTAIQRRDFETRKSDAYSLQPLQDIHLYKADGTDGGFQIVRLFLIVAILILVIASVNYVNLATARSMLRSKEVGVRKVVGAGRRQLFIQFIVETLLVFVFVTLLALALVWVLMPVYNDLSGKNMRFNWLDGNVWTVIALTITGTLALSGIYPALVQSTFDPLQVLKGKFSAGVGAAAFRKVLVVTQFVFSIALITGTIVIGGQLQYIHDKELGYDKSHVFYFGMRDMRAHYEAVKSEMMRQSGVSEVTSANSLILNNTGSTTGSVDWEGKDPDKKYIIHPLVIDENFIPLFDMKLVSGRNFRPGKADSTSYILNETAVREMGLKDPVGKSFKLWGNAGTIIGVVKDFHFGSLKDKIGPSVLAYGTANWNLFVKTTGKDAPKVIAAARKLWKQYNAGFPFEYKFMDETYDEMYRSEQRTGTLFSFFATMAILISCLGLLGLVTYAAQVKRKEIGIRKVLGASVASVTALLSRDFIRLILVAIVIATPLAWYAMNRWLENFAYRIEIKWWMFCLAGLLAVLVALLTVSFQSIKSALMNPVKALRSE